MKNLKLAAITYFPVFLFHDPFSMVRVALIVDKKSSKGGAISTTKTKGATLHNLCGRASRHST